jgi:predicted MFS family arabinose efflux permease
MTGQFSAGAWTAFSIGSTFVLYASVVSIMPSFLGPDLRAAYAISDARLGELSSLFFYVSGPALLVVGACLDRFGGRRCLVVAIAACVAGLVPFLVSDRFALAAAGRALSGFGGAFAFVGALWLLSRWFPRDRFATLSGLVNAVGTVGTALAADLLDNLSRATGWRPLTALLVAVGLAILLAAALRLRDPPHTPDSSGGALLATLAEPLRRVAGSPQAWLLGLVCMLFYMPVTVYSMLWGESELKTDHGFGDILAEALATSVLVGVAAGNAAAGWLSDRLDRRRPLIVAGTVLANAAFAAAIYLPIESPALIAAALFAAGFFVGAQILVYAIAGRLFDTSVAGMAIAFISMIGAGAAAIFQPLVGIMVERTGSSFREALVVVPVALAAATALSCFLRDGRRDAAGARS